MKMLVLTFFLFLLVNGCSVKAVYHDEDKAIDTANQFLRYLIRENYTAAYNNYISGRNGVKPKKQDEMGSNLKNTLYKMLNW